MKTLNLTAVSVLLALGLSLPVNRQKLKNLLLRLMVRQPMPMVQ